MRPLVVIVFVAALTGTCSSPPPILDQVLETGELRVVTRDSPTSYTISPDGPTGPEYDLVQTFADELGVSLVIETVDSVSEILPILLSGQAHMAAAGLSVTNSRREYLNFGHPYESVDVHLVYKLGTGRPRTVEDLLGRRIEVMASTSHVDLLETIKAEYPTLSWTENADIEIADLLTKVAMGETVAVIGCGGVGMAAINGAYVAGAGRVIAVAIHRVSSANLFGRAGRPATSVRHGG